MKKVMVIVSVFVGMIVLFSIFGVVLNAHKKNIEDIELIEKHRIMRQKSFVMCIVNNDELNMTGEFRVMDVLIQRDPGDKNTIRRRSVVLNPDLSAKSNMGGMVFMNQECGKVVLSDEGYILWHEGEDMMLFDRIDLIKAGKRDRL